MLINRTIRVVELENDRYSIRFAPVGSGGGAQQAYEVPGLEGTEELMDVLSNLTIPVKQAQQGLADLGDGDASIAVTDIPGEPLRHYGLI